MGIDSDGMKHPTSAGLLMFGNEYDIVREYNAYFLDYQEQYDADTRWTDRMISSSAIAEYIGLKPSRTRDYLNELIAEGIILQRAAIKTVFTS